MKTFVFNESNGNAGLTLSAEDYQAAIKYMKDLGLNPNHWACEDEDGEDEHE